MDFSGNDWVSEVGTCILCLDRQRSIGSQYGNLCNSDIISLGGESPAAVAASIRGLAVPEEGGYEGHRQGGDGSPRSRSSPARSVGSSMDSATRAVVNETFLQLNFPKSFPAGANIAGFSSGTSCSSSAIMVTDQQQDSR